MQPLPGHALGPLEHGRGIHQFGPVPMLLQNAPAPLHRVVLAVVRRIVQELDGLTDVIGECHHTLEKLGALAIAFRAIVGLDLEQRATVADLAGLARPPRVEAIDDEIASFGGTAEDQVQLPAILVHHAERGVFFVASHIVIDGSVVAPGFAPARVVADVHRGLAVHAHAQDGLPFGVAGSVLVLDVSEDGVGLRDFFWGLALTTGRSR